jgi:hypothetical protein
MNQSNVAKVLAAFLAGVVLTMGSLTYSRNHELNRFRKAAGNAESSAPAPIETFASASPKQEPSKASEDVTLSSTSVPNVEALSNGRVSTEVPEPAVPKAARPRRLRSRGAQTAQNAVPGDAPSAVDRDAASASAGSGDVWHTLPATDPVAVHAQQPSSAETTSQRSPTVVTLQPGTSISIRLEQNVSTDRNRSGDVFRGSLDSPLAVNGSVLAERGARVLGQIEKSKRARLLGSRADLSLRLTEISMADGQRVAIQTSPWEEKGALASMGERPKMAASAALGAVVGALTGAAKGAGFVSDDAVARKDFLAGVNKRSLVLATGARLTFRVAIPVTITEGLGPH